MYYRFRCFLNGKATDGMATMKSRAGPSDERGSKHGQRAAYLICYINSITTRGGASEQANGTATQRGSVNEGVIRKDNE